MKKTLTIALVLVLALGLLIGCTPKEETATTEQAQATTEDAYPNGLSFSDMLNASVYEAPAEITTLDANGKPATWYTELSLSKEELEKIRSMNLTACFEYINTGEWDGANYIGFKEACDAMNVKIAGTAVCDLDPVTQKANMETFSALNPSWITCQPQDLQVAAATFDPLYKQGIKMSYMSNVPAGYEAGKQYVAAITDSVYDMGVQSAEMMAEAIGNKGKVIAIMVSDVNYVCNTRDGAFLDTIAAKYPDIEVVEGGFSTAEQAGQTASALLTANPDAAGVFVSYSTPAINVLQTVKDLGLSKVKIVTMDLDSTCALDMAQGGNIYGIACDMPYAMGFGRALICAYGSLGKDCPAFITSPSFKVTRDNLYEGYLASLGTEPSAEVKAALGK